MLQVLPISAEAVLASIEERGLGEVILVLEPVPVLEYQSVNKRLKYRGIMARLTGW